MPLNLKCVDILACEMFATLSDILQGSVATHWRCGGIFCNGIIANFLPILAVKQLCKSVNI